jgi:hypothetical protein
VADTLTSVGSDDVVNTVFQEVPKSVEIRTFWSVSTAVWYCPVADIPTPVTAVKISTELQETPKLLEINRLVEVPTVWYWADADTAHGPKVIPLFIFLEDHVDP